MDSDSERDSEILWEVQKLKEKFEEISERYDEQQSSLDSFSKSIDDLNETVKRLVSVFERAEKIVASDKGNEKIDALVKQSSNLAKAVNNLAGEVQKSPQVMSRPSPAQPHSQSTPQSTPKSPIPEVPRSNLEPENPVPKPYKEENPSSPGNDSPPNKFTDIPPPPQKSKGFFK